MVRKSTEKGFMHAAIPNVKQRYVVLEIFFERMSNDLYNYYPKQHTLDIPLLVVGTA